MTDHELNKLITQALERQKQLEDINQNIMLSIRQENRRERVRKWLRLLAFCFGLPLFVILMLYCAYKGIVQSGFSLPVVFSMLVFAFSIIGAGYQMIENFSAQTV